jgi:DNA-binding NtrC family response regulator
MALVTIIDRDPEFRAILSKLLTTSGFDTTGCRDVRQGLTKIAQLRTRRQDACVIVLGVDGWNFDVKRFTQQRGLLGLGNVPVVLLIGQPSLAALAQELHPFATLGKVENLPRIVEAVQSACDTPYQAEPVRPSASARSRR